ncbi:DUF6916 family protein [Sphingosinicella sp. LY1275]|uniref:DUF6916 family protein n=1 Tax=Sphingosinicella sp. LY1275 TaxID=3095379 RepID=UPI002ADEE4BB|nr:hypothetical protein [Sphingosinicella sp. LY1275]MEA1016052.1 hypothetical protein [Sphingosinicella sp. LY1275]
MGDPGIEDFAGRVGKSFTVESGAGALEMTLETAQPLPAGVREAGSFRLVFRGPSEPALPQAIYPFVYGGDAFDIFIVPIARDPDGILYEAIFN